MNQFNPLKYRGVFDYPIIQTRNLLPTGNEAEEESVVVHLLGPGLGTTIWRTSPTAKNEKPANPTNTSGHVLKFFGWSASGHSKPTYLGTPATGRVLDQREEWIQIWLQKGRNEHEKELRLAAKGRKKASSVSAQKSA